MDLYRRIHVDFDASRFDPLHTDDEAWNRAAAWREQMNAAIKRPAR